MSIESYPLAWPPGWNRTPAHKRRRARFSRGDPTPFGDRVYQRRKPLSVSDGLRRVLNELRKFGVDGHNVIVSTNLQVRLDGLPRSGQRRPDDPGVAVYWQREREPQRCMAIDLYDDVADNLAAIAATLSAMRAIERHGGAEIMDRAFTGFLALPEPGRQKHWREVLGFAQGERVSAEEVKQRYRRLASQHHPDRGGSTQMMSALNVAVEQAITDLEAEHG